MAVRPLRALESGTDLEKKLGIGKAEGAGDAWNVGPAYAGFEGVVTGLL
jgi:hypothetical protein